jgi:predicted DNA repair protein MutK
MASGLLLLLDDIASILDDVAVLTKTTVSKTAGVIGDDLALNAQQVSGVTANRELPIVWAVAKGSAMNKAILVPAALVLSWVAPITITPLLVIGGSYLCYEGCEKLAHRFLHSHGDDESHHAQHAEIIATKDVDVVQAEKDKIRGAVRTDFILSAEIIVIALGIVENSPLMTKIFVMIGVAVLMTVGVYGLVAAIVKLDDLGALLVKRPGWQRLGRFLLGFSPYLMKFLTIAGTAAMFFVGGGILVHKSEWLHDHIEPIIHRAGEIPIVGFVLETLAKLTLEGGVGVIAGALVLLAVFLVKKLFHRDGPASKQPA